jgi:hypothetical protein
VSGAVPCARRSTPTGSSRSSTPTTCITRGRGAGSIGTLIERLGDAVAAPEHAFRPDDASLLDGSRVLHSRIHGPRQLTDGVLLGLAVANGGRLATLDEAIRARRCWARRRGTWWSCDRPSRPAEPA